MDRTKSKMINLGILFVTLVAGLSHAALTPVLEYTFPASYDGTGTTIVDQSTAGNNGVMDATGAYATGIVPPGGTGGSLDCSIGHGYTDGTQLLHNDLLEANGGFTMDVTFKTPSDITEYGTLVSYAGTEQISIQEEDGTDKVYFQINGSGRLGQTTVAVDSWYRVVAEFDTSGNTVTGGSLEGEWRVWLDDFSGSGLQLIDSGTITKSSFGDGLNRKIGIGRHPYTGQLLSPYNGYIYAAKVDLSVVKQSPWGPNPSDGQPLVGVDTILSWQAPEAYSATGYDVYLGTDPNEALFVKILDKKNQTNVDPVLVDDTTYYWKVIAYEPNSPSDIPHKGAIWSFTTAPMEPVVEIHPADQTVAIGGTATFTVTGLNQTSYEWYSSTDDTNATPGDDILLGTLETLELLNVQTSQEGFVYCKLINEAGFAASDIALLMTKRDVAQWDLEGDLTDSVGSNDGSATLPVYTADGIVGTQSLQVTPGDPNTMVVVPNAAELNNTQSFTIEAWVKPASNPANGAIVSSRGGTAETGVDSGYVIYTVSGGRVGLWVNDNGTWQETSTTTANVVTVDQWNYVAVTFDNGTVTIYVNGEQGAQGTGRVMKRNSTTDFYIGAGENEAAEPQFYFDGLIDQVKISSGVTLDAYAVANNYVAQFPEADICVEQTGLDYDLDGDCDVDLADFALLASEWLNCNRVAGMSSGFTDCK